MMGLHSATLIALRLHQLRKWMEMEVVATAPMLHFLLKQVENQTMAPFYLLKSLDSAWCFLSEAPDTQLAFLPLELEELQRKHHSLGELMKTPLLALPVWKIVSESLLHFPL